MKFSKEAMLGKRKERLGALVPNRWKLISQEEISHSSDNVSDCLAGEIGAETMAGPWWTVYTLHASCP